MPELRAGGQCVCDGGGCEAGRAVGDEMTISKDLLLAVRQALLMIVDAIERELGLTPRTAEVRREIKGR